MGSNYSVVVLSQSRSQLFRLSVASHTLRRLLLGMIGFVVANVAVLLHLNLIATTAQFSEQLRFENRQLKRKLNDLQASLESLQQSSQSTNNLFLQLWSKSGLHHLEQEAVPSQAAFSAYAKAPLALPPRMLIDVAVDAAWLSQQLQRSQHFAQNLQQTLVESLEYFHDTHRLLAHTPSIHPTLNHWMTSPFGKRRDPIFHRLMLHKGIDFGGSIGAPVMAPADGLVIWTGLRGGYGQTVVLDHGYGLQTHFAHLSQYMVKPNQWVRRGEIIAKIGTTGKSTGPHLHYEVRRFGEPLNPLHFILD